MSKFFTSPCLKILICEAARIVVTSVSQGTPGLNKLIPSVGGLVPGTHYTFNVNSIHPPWVPEPNPLHLFSAHSVNGIHWSFRPSCGYHITWCGAASQSSRNAMPSNIGVFIIIAILSINCRESMWRCGWHGDTYLLLKVQNVLLKKEHTDSSVPTRKH